MPGVTFLKRSTLPPAIKGKEGTLQVTITEMGQVVLSSKATKAINGANHLALGFQDGKVMLFTPEAPLVVKAKMDTKDMIGLNKAKKGGTVSFSGASILRDSATFGTHLYDFKASGNQSFPVTVDDKQKFISFDLPKGAKEKRPVVARAPRKKKTVAPGTPAEVSSTVAAASTEPTLELETA